MASARDRSKERAAKGVVPGDASRAWVEALLAIAEGGSGSIPDVPAASVGRVGLAEARFGLDEVERCALRVLAVASRVFSVSRRMRALAGGPRITVEVLRELVAIAGHDGLEPRLAPDAKLRGHALVHVDDADGRWVAASDPVRLEVGIEPVAPMGGGMRTVELITPGEGAAPSYVARMAGPKPQLVMLEPMAGAERATAAAIATGLARPVAFFRATGSETAAEVARLRRDVDLAAAILFFTGDPRAELFVAPPAGAEAPPLIVGVGTREPRPHAGWVLRRERVAVEQNAKPTNEIDRIRMLAQRDADRAMGIVRPDQPERPSVPGHIVDAGVRIAEATERAPSVDAADAVAAAQARPLPEAPPATSAVPVAVTPPAAVVITPPATSAVPVTVTPPAAVAITPPVAPAASAVPAAVVPAATLTATAPAPASSVPDGVPLEIPPNPTPDVLARAAMQSPSATQRIDLLRSLAGIRSPAVVAALRHNVRSEHAPLREVAEAMMAQLFGAAWNRSRAITPPVQTPPSDDGGRGPGGAT